MVPSSIDFCAMSVTRRCRSYLCATMKRPTTMQRVMPDETANQAPARIRRFHPGPRDPGRMERPDAEPDERGGEPHHRRELRLGGRCAGHEGQLGAAGFG